MKRPRGHSRARWFAQRRNRRGRPFSLHNLDRVYRRMALDYGASMTRTLLAAKPWKQLKEQGQ